MNPEKSGSFWRSSKLTGRFHGSGGWVHFGPHDLQDGPAPPLHFRRGFALRTDFRLDCGNSRAAIAQNFYFWFFLLGTNIFLRRLHALCGPLHRARLRNDGDYNSAPESRDTPTRSGKSLGWRFLGLVIMSNKRLFVDSVHGARGLAIGVGITVAALGIMPAIFCKEPFFQNRGKSRRATQGRWRIFSGPHPPRDGILQGFLDDPEEHPVY